MAGNEVKALALQLARQLWREDWYNYTGSEADSLLAERAIKARPELAHDYRALRATVLAAMAAIIDWRDTGAADDYLDSAELAHERELIAQQA